jgi:single-stranded DNA-binding protein
MNERTSRTRPSGAQRSNPPPRSNGRTEDRPRVREQEPRRDKPREEIKRNANYAMVEGPLHFEPRFTALRDGSVCNMVVDVPTGMNSPEGKPYTTTIRAVAFEQDCGRIPDLFIGDVVNIEGRIRSRAYVNKSDQKVEVTELVASKLTVISHGRAPDDPKGEVEDQEYDR